MSPDILEFAQVSAILVFVVGSLCTIGVLTARAIQRIRRQAPSLPPQTNLALEQLRQSVDAIAIEVERIAEAQRFTAKLLSERREDASLPR
jgi:hypothetical protein